MATPERRIAPGAPVPTTTAASAAGPVPVMAPFGWTLILAAGIGLILSSWLLYGTSADGMWAGYWSGIIGTIVVAAGMALNSTLPAKPSLGICGVCGVGLVLLAVFVDHGQTVFITQLVGGVVLLVGVALRVAGRTS